MEGEDEGSEEEDEDGEDEGAPAAEVQVRVGVCVHQPQMSTMHHIRHQTPGWPAQFGGACAAVCHGPRSGATFQARCFPRILSCQ